MDRTQLFALELASFDCSEITDWKQSPETYLYITKPSDSGILERRTVRRTGEVLSAVQFNTPMDGGAAQHEDNSKVRPPVFDAAFASGRNSSDGEEDKLSQTQHVSFGDPGTGSSGLSRPQSSGSTWTLSTGNTIERNDANNQIAKNGQKKADSRSVAWMDLPQKQQLLVIVLTRLSEPLVQTSLQSYMFYQ